MRQAATDGRLNKLYDVRSFLPTLFPRNCLTLFQNVATFPTCDETAVNGEKGLVGLKPGTDWTYLSLCRDLLHSAYLVT